MLVACVFIPHLPVKAELARRPDLDGHPFLIVRADGSLRTVADFSPGLAGVHAGMPLQQALALAREAALVEEDAPHYRAAFDDVLERLEQRSPVVEDGGLGCAYAGLDGLEELYGGSEAVVVALQNAVPPSLEARVGVGDGKFLARVAALSARPGGAFMAPDDSRAFLQGLPVDVLPVPYQTSARLRSFGLDSLKDVAAVGVGPLQAQFGLEGRLMWELACGIDRAPLSPRPMEEVVSESLTFHNPSASLGMLLTAVEVLLGRAFSRPQLRGRYARVALLDQEVARRGVVTRRIAFREPVGDKARALFIIKSGLESHSLPGPLEGLKLTLLGLTGEAGKQESLLGDVRRREQLGAAVRQLEASLGAKPPIYTVREVEPWSRIPERRLALVQFEP